MIFLSALVEFFGFRFVFLCATFFGFFVRCGFAVFGCIGIVFGLAVGLLLLCLFVSVACVGEFWMEFFLVLVRRLLSWFEFWFFFSLCVGVGSVRIWFFSCCCVFFSGYLLFLGVCFCFSVIRRVCIF